MRIEFDPMNRDEATAVRAVLTAIHGPEWTGKVITKRFEDWDQPEELTHGPTDVPDLDSTGTPWDERIHSNPPTQNKDGTWRAKRGVKPELVEQVRAEREALEANLTAKDAELVEQAKPLEIATAQEQSAPPAPNAPVQAPTPPAPPSAPVADEPQVTLSQPSFLDVMKAITAAQKDGKIDTVKVKEMCAAVGAGDSTMGLNGPDNADKRSAFMALLASEIGE